MNLKNQKFRSIRRVILSTARDLKRVLQGAKYLLKLKYLMTLEMLRISHMLALRGSRTVGENFTLGQRGAFFGSVMMEKIMNNLDEELDRNVKSYLREYIS